MFRFVLLISLIFSSASHAAPFGDADKGKIKSPSCVYCHGATGVAGNNVYPNLAGQNAQYLYDAMKSYQAGERKGPLCAKCGHPFIFTAPPSPCFPAGTGHPALPPPAAPS